MSVPEESLRRLARLSPRSPRVDPDGDLATALAFLDAGLPPGTLVRAADGAALVAAVACLPALVLVPSPLRPAGVAGVVAAALGVATAVRAVPRLAATARRSRALGAAPRLVGRAVMRMRVEPTAEAAAAFAARTDGRLAESLEAHVRAADGTPRSGMAAFAEEWRQWFPALRRAASLVEAAAVAPAGARERTLDRAMDAVLEGTRDRAAAFAAGIQGPATAVYAFGVLLPLALVAVLPAARVAGLPVGLGVVVVVYDLALPAVLAVATAWLLARRPLAFPPRPVPRSHPDLPDSPWPPAVAGAGTATAGSVGAAVLLPGWTVPLAGLGGGLGAALVVRYRPVRGVRERVRAVESGLPDALYLVGRRLGEGVAVERAVGTAAAELDGPTGEVFGAAARRQRQLRVGVREAFLGERGALADLHSPQVRGSVALLALAAREGRPAGAAVVAFADHLDDLGRVERESRRAVRRVASTLGNTAAVFAPLVGGATVALADGMAGGSLGAASIPTAPLGVAVGGYVLLLSAVLTALATGLERGFDRALVGYRAGVALLSATAVYLTGFAAASALT